MQVTDRPESASVAGRVGEPDSDAGGMFIPKPRLHVVRTRSKANRVQERFTILSMIILYLFSTKQDVFTE